MVAAALVTACVACRSEAPLAPTLVVEDVLEELGTQLPNLQRESLDPGEALRGDGARTSLILEPGATATVHATVPANAALRFGIGVGGAKERDQKRTGLRFAVTVDGAPVFSRVVNPASTRRDRRWYDERIDLRPYAGRAVEITLGVDAESAGRSVAGPAGWSRVRLVRATEVTRQRASAGHPNVIVLLVDTLRADAVGLYGAGADATPTLDALGRRGTVFLTAVGQSSWTLPSVASLLTGLPPRQHGAVGEPARAGRRRRAEWGYLADGVTTWAETAAHAGITTFAASANPLVSAGTNFTQGLETVVELPWDSSGRNWAPADDVNAALLAWLPRCRGFRFVAYLHYMEPHDPYTPPDAGPAPAGVRTGIASGWVRDAANHLNWGGRDPLTAGEVTHLRRRYAGEVRAWDRALAKLLAGLTAAGVADDTVVIVTADHGEEFQEHGRLTHGSQLYDESIRVPLVLAGPGVPVGKRPDLAQGIDMFPTLAHLLNTDLPSGLGGRDLLAGADERPAIVETASGIGPDGGTIEVVAMRTAHWKLVHMPGLARTELYDLAADPLERSDRSAGSPLTATLLRELERRHDAAPVAPAGGPGDPVFAAKLRALGYAE